MKPSADEAERYKLFWERYGRIINAEAEVSVVATAGSARSLNMYGVRDIDDKPVPGFEGMTDGFLFFVDPTPRANWAHECWYIMVGPERPAAHPREVRRTVHNWPPAATLELKWIERPKRTTNV